MGRGARDDEEGTESGASPLMPHRRPAARHRPCVVSRIHADGEIACIVDARLTIPCGGAEDLRSRSRRLRADRLRARHRLLRVAERSRHGRAVVSRPCAPGTRGESRRFRATPTRRRSPAMAPWCSRCSRIARISPTSPATGGPTRQLTTFQSETPSYHPTRPLIAFTYGTWRRVIDDAKYPDIAQEIGVDRRRRRPLPAAKPLEVIAQSDSEDQAMAWSPNGKWIAFHTHREMSDDVWLRPADGERSRTSASRSWAAARKSAGRAGRRMARRVLLDGARKSDGAFGDLRDRRRSGHRRDHVGAARSAGRRLRRRDHACRMAAGNSTVIARREGRARPPRDLHGAGRRRHADASCIAIATEHDFSGSGRVDRRQVGRVCGAGA